MPQVVGRNVSERRQALRWSQEQLAERLRDAGLSWDRPMVARFEAGSRPLSAADLLLLALVLDTTVPALVSSTGTAVALSPGVRVPGERLSDMVMGKRWTKLPPIEVASLSEDQIRGIEALLLFCGVQPSPETVAKVCRARGLAAERKATALLMHPSNTVINETDTDDPDSLVVAASLRLWKGHTLTEALEVVLGKPTGSVASEAMRRSHALRRMVQELETFIRSLPRGDAPGEEV